MFPIIVCIFPLLCNMENEKEKKVVSLVSWHNAKS